MPGGPKKETTEPDTVACSPPKNGISCPPQLRLSSSCRLSSNRPAENAAQILVAIPAVVTSVVPTFITRSRELIETVTVSLAAQVPPIVKSHLYGIETAAPV